MYKKQLYISGYGITRGIRVAPNCSTKSERGKKKKQHFYCNSARD